jgi:serine/threonine protein kinase
VSQIVERHVERLGRGLDPATVFYLAHDVLQALGYAHELRNASGDPLAVVHRDVSPANVMVSTRGDVKLLDFGIVKSEDRISTSDIANIKGNPGFMAPEQARGLPVDARSDLFSVGLVMYYALTGHMLYRMGTSGETLFQAATGPSREQLDSILALPQPAARIIARALGAEPEDRFRTADEFAAALAPEVRQGARSHTVNLLQSLFGFEFQLEGVAPADRTTPMRPRAV